MKYCFTFMIQFHHFNGKEGEGSPYDNFIDDYLFICQQIFIKCLLPARHCSRYTNEAVNQEKYSAFIYSLHTGV